MLNKLRTCGKKKQFFIYWGADLFVLITLQIMAASTFDKTELTVWVLFALFSLVNRYFQFTSKDK